jgi:reverse gyrase
LFIVESPTKARQISRFFGRPSIRVLEDIIVYEVPTPEYVLLVTASLGHVTDLITNRGFHGVEIFEIPDSPHSHFVPVFTSIKRCTSCGYQFTFEVEKCPRCRGDVSDSGRRIEVLRKLAYETGRVIIGTDPDSEGEKIAWDLSNLLSGCGEIKRAEFHEVTKKALVKALSNLREVDENMVKAQILRRIEDRWIGFVLSRKLQRTFHDRNLSAGRAQTPVLGWILERTKESRRKKVVAWFEDLDLEIESVEEEEVDLEIELISDETVKKSPLPPYTTDTLLRDANRILKLGAVRTMEIAQNLFENGLITYHRTDSTRVSDVGGRIAKDYLGKDFFPREWHAEGAHECIRPTRPLDRNLLRRLVYEGVLRAEGLERIHISLYDLIFRRFMASQCRDFTARIVKYRIRYRDRIFEEERVISAQGRAFDLYKSVELKKELPTGKLSVKAELRRVPKVTPYSEAELVHLMKTRGIGRPSTYATLIERLFSRGYVIERNGRVVGTRKGFVIFDFLSERYQDLISEKRTRILEEKMDKVANGELEYTKALLELYEEIKEVEGV